VDGLEAIRAIAADAPAHLLPDGWLLLEHGMRQGELIQALLRESGYEEIATSRDLAGRPRVTRARHSGA
jgi:release factor glutamine methyltransferase